MCHIMRSPCYFLHYGNCNFSINICSEGMSKLNSVGGWGGVYFSGITGGNSTYLILRQNYGPLNLEIF